MKQKILIDNQRHLWLSQNHTAMKLAMYELNQQGIDILKYLVEKATEQGVKMENMQEAINELLENEAVQDTLIEFFRQFSENQD